MFSKNRKPSLFIEIKWESNQEIDLVMLYQIRFVLVKMYRSRFVLIVLGLNKHTHVMATNFIWV